MSRVLAVPEQTTMIKRLAFSSLRDSDFAGRAPRKVAVPQKSAWFREKDLQDTTGGGNRAEKHTVAEKTARAF